MTASGSEEMLTPAEVAEIMKVSRGTVMRWLREEGPDKLTGYKIGRGWRISRSELNEFVERHKK